MKNFVSIVVLVTTFLLYCACSEENKSTGNGDKDDNELIVTADGDSWSTTNVTLAGSQIYGGEGSAEGTKSVTLRIGYAPKVGVIEKKSEYSTRNPEGVSNEWVDESGKIELTLVTEERVEGTFEFVGINEKDNSSKSVSGSFSVERRNY